jgi:predicted AlkP superfamily pyrophosphatase or phosphodiesterase
MHATLVLDVAGLTPALLEHDAPNLRRLASRGGLRAVDTVVPAVTNAVQSSFVTGTLPREHGIVANGWYFRELSEVWLWRQSNRLVAGEKIWETARRRDPGFTCAKLFWWHNMYASVDWSVTPRPIYRADGRKLPDIHTHPPELRDHLNATLGEFPLFRFWGPAADIVSSDWIARCARTVRSRYRPTLTLVYLPHLDYNLQRLGPDHPDIKADVAKIDALCGHLIDTAERDGDRVIVLSEYGITPVHRPIHINRVLRDAGLIRVREELGTELLDAGASSAFAVADHQVAHIYIQNAALIGPVRSLLQALPGVERVLDGNGKRDAGLDHPRSGELVAIAHADSWFTWYYFMDDERAPDFARTVDIHRKPGYDPLELFIDPALRFPKLRIASRLARKAIGMRYLMDVIPLDATLVKGSHGRPTDRPEHGPLLMSSEPRLLPRGRISALDVKGIMLDHLFTDARQLHEAA